MKHLSTGQQFELPAHNASGFSLVELMIVVAIIGLLASVAMPQYQIYMTRTKVTSSLSTARTMQMAITEHAARTGELPADQNALTAFGVSSSPSAYASDLVAGVSYDSSQRITIEYRQNKEISSDMRGKKLIIQAVQENNAISYAIANGEAGGSLDTKYRPNLSPNSKQ